MRWNEGDGRRMNDVIVLLKRIRRERHELLVITETAADLRMMLLPSGIQYNTDRVQTSVDPDGKQLKIVAQLVEIEKRQDVLTDKLGRDILLAEELIGSMTTPEYRELIRLRYLTGGTKPLTWEEIAEKMEYSTDHVRGKLHGKAVAEARKVWKEL